MSTTPWLSARKLLIIFLLLCTVFGLVAQGMRAVDDGHLFAGDGFFYYSYLPNIYFKHNLDFAEAYARYQPQGPMWSRIVPETGLWSNVWSVGPAVMWLPGFLLGDLIWRAAQLAGAAGPTDGYDLYHEGGAALAALVWSLLAIMLTYRIARYLVSPKAATLATITIWLGTPLLAYGFIEVDMSHSVGAFAGAALLATTISAWRKPYLLKRWLLCGLCMGLLILIRPNHAVMFLLPLGAWLASFRSAGQERRNLSLQFGNLGAMLASSVLVFIPQALSWKAIFGHFLVMPQSNYFAGSGYTKLFASLFSTQNGYFSWTPLWAVALVGVVLIPRNFRWFAGWLATVLVLEMISNAWAADWSGGEAFGARRLIELGPGVALGLAALFERLKSRRLALFSLVILCCCYWNIALMCRYYSKQMPHCSAMPVADFVAGTLVSPARLLGR